jgi:hypothetical protein
VLRKEKPAPSVNDLNDYDKAVAEEFLVIYLKGI